MSYISELYKRHHWYIAHEIMAVETDGKLADEGITVWENLILIRASNPDEAYEKAIQHGLASEDAIKVDGRDGRLKFHGLRDLVLIFDELEDGAELEWHERSRTKNELSGLVKPKESMQAFNLQLRDDD